MPDLVLHGTGSDERLKQCLLADLVHTVHVSDPSPEPAAAGSVTVRVLASNRCLGCSNRGQWNEGLVYRDVGRVAGTNKGW